MVSMIFSGVMMSLRLKKRCVFLSETLLFISQVSLEIEFVNLPVFDILRKIESDGCCRSLDYIGLCVGKMQSGKALLSSWNESVEQSALPLKREEREKLKNLGSMLGTSDAQGQRAVLSLYKSYFTVYYEKALLEYEKYARTCVTLGIAAGVGFFILII